MSNPKQHEEARANALIYKGMFEKGLSIVEIAKQLGVHRGTVERWVYKEFKCPKRRPAINWSKEMDAKLKELWAQNLAAKDIGKALGMTKGSILGRRFRLKLENHAMGTRVGSKRPRAKSVRRVIPVTEFIIEVPHDPVGFMDLQEHHCREVTGRGLDGLATYCGGQRVHFLHNGTPVYVDSYCSYHSDINHQP